GKHIDNRSTNQRGTQKGASNEVRQVYWLRCAPGNDSRDGAGCGSEIGFGNDRGDRGPNDYSIAAELKRTATCDVRGNHTGGVDVRRRARICGRSDRLRSAAKQTSRGRLESGQTGCTEVGRALEGRT